MKVLKRAEFPTVQHTCEDCASPWKSARLTSVEAMSMCGLWDVRTTSVCQEHSLPVCRHPFYRHKVFPEGSLSRQDLTDDRLEETVFARPYHRARMALNRRLS